MTHEELREFAKRQPFKPFRLHLTTGATYDIGHPDLIMVGRRSAVIGVSKKLDETIADRLFQIDLLHVVGVEDLPARSGRRNGKG